MDRGPQLCAGPFTFCGNIFPIAVSMCVPLFCFSIVSSGTWPTPLLSVPFREGSGSFPERGACKQIALCWLEKTTGLGRPLPTTEVNLALSLLQVKPCSVQCLTASCVTPISRCNWQKCLECYSWWLAQWWSLLSSLGLVTHAWCSAQHHPI